MSVPRNPDDDDPFITPEEAALALGGTAAGAITTGHLVNASIEGRRQRQEFKAKNYNPAYYSPGYRDPYQPFYKQPILGAPRGGGPFDAAGNLRPRAYSIENIVRPSSRPKLLDLVRAAVEKR